MSSAGQHRLSDLAEREERIREALGQPGGAVRAKPGHYVSYYSRGELREELAEIAEERAQLRPRQPHPAPLEGRTREPGRQARPPYNRRKTLKSLKHILAAAVLGADILFGMAAPQVFKGLHKETQQHMYGTIGYYAVLALLTLLVVVSVVRNMPGKAQAASAPRPVSTFGPRR